MDVMTWLRQQWDRAGGAALVALGLVSLTIGWWGASSTAYPAEQIPYVISGGLVGLALIGTGATLWLSADLRDEWRKLDELDASIRAGTTAVTQVTREASNGLVDDHPGRSKSVLAADTESRAAVAGDAPATNGRASAATRSRRARPLQR